jgi:membrane protease YdiL (CAAX protease family)
MKTKLKDICQMTFVAILVIAPVVIAPIKSLMFYFLLAATLAVIIFTFNAKNDYKWLVALKSHANVGTVIRGLLLGVVLWVAFDVLLTPLVESLLMTETDYSRFEAIRNNLAKTLKLLASIWLSAAICEEVIFRGFLVDRITTLASRKWLAVLISAILFGLMHFYQGASGIVITMIGGLVFGYLYLRSKFNLLLLVISHGVADSIFFINIYFGWDKWLKSLMGTATLASTAMFAIPANKEAPVFEHQEIFIEARSEIVWKSLTEIDRWPEWQTNITSAQLNGGLAAGTTFDWEAGGLPFKSAIHTCKPAKYLGWTGRTIGASAIHNWTIIDQGEGTKVVVEESLDGVFPRLLSGKFSDELKEGMKVNLLQLRQFALTQREGDL